ncbi:MAG: hypothetical protein ACSHYF_18400 [Verrucomicrobiaceae bacterium]
MKTRLIKMTSAAGAFAAAFFLSSCDVDKTAEGELPEVEVDVKGDAGKLPEYEVEGPEVKTGTKTVEVEVPTVDVDLPEEEDNE